MNRLLFVLASILLLALPITAQAMWTANGTIVCAATGIQTAPAVVPDGTGGGIVVWQDTRNAVDRDIYAQRMNAMGNAVWAGDGVPICIAIHDQGGPRAVSDGAGGAIITWYDHRNGTDDDIYAQRINSAGAVQWTANGVALCNLTGNQAGPAIASDGVGGATVSWADNRGADYDIYAQRINATGAVQWTGNGVAVCAAVDNQSNGAIVPSGASGAIFTWYDNRSGTNADIYAQRLNSAGAVQWTANGVALCTAANDQDAPVAVSDGLAGAIVAWEDFRGGVEYDIYAQRVDKSGFVQWASNGVALCTATGDDLAPHIVTDGRSGAIVCWSDNRQATNQDIYAQRVTTLGVAAWTSDGVGICTEASTQAEPAITADGADGAIISWEDVRTGNYDIYAQRVNASGAAQWAGDGIALVTAPLQQSVSAIAADGSGALLAWVDHRTDTSGDIYALRAGSSGTVLTGVGGATPALALSVGDNHPNPFTTDTSLDVTAAHESAVSIEVFDVAGHRVRSINERRVPAGVSHLIFDGLDDHARALPSGVYFYRVQAGSETVTEKIVIAR